MSVGYQYRGDLAHVDDPSDTVPFTPLLQHWYQLLCQGEYPLNVESQKLGPCLIGIFVERFAPRRAGVVDLYKSGRNARKILPCRYLPGRATLSRQHDSISTGEVLKAYLLPASQSP